MSRLIIIDGLDGSGKGTQISRLQKHFEHRPVVFTREPGGTPRAERIRQILLENAAQSASPMTELLLFFAARHDHIAHLIAPMLAQGYHVIGDRYDSSSDAFQLFGEEQYENLIGMFEYLRERIVGSARWNVGMPAAYLFLDLPALVAYDRCRLASAEKTSKFDLKPLEYHERVRKGFQHFAETYGGTSEMFFVDADRPVDVVQADLVEIIERIFEGDEDNYED